KKRRCCRKSCRAAWWCGAPPRRSGHGRSFRRFVVLPDGFAFTKGGGAAEVTGRQAAHGEKWRKREPSQWTRADRRSGKVQAVTEETRRPSQWKSASRDSGNAQTVAVEKRRAVCDEAGRRGVKPRERHGAGRHSKGGRSRAES